MRGGEDGCRTGRVVLVHWRASGEIWKGTCVGALTVLVISLLVAICISFVCSLCEATLLSLTPSQIAKLSGKNPALGGVWERFKAEIDRPIGVILLLNTTAHTIGATVAGAQVGDVFGNQWVGLFGIVFTYIMLQFTEILPKTLGVRYNLALAGIIAYPLYYLTRLLSPVLYLLHVVNRPFEGKHDNAISTPPALEEIKMLAGMARYRKMIGQHEEKIIQNAARLARTPVRSVMIPAHQVTFISTSQSVTDAVIIAHLDPHTRFPVCEDGDHDQVLGYINFKEMIYRLKTNPNDPSIRGIVRPVRFATPDTTGSELLQAFVEQHVHMAIVQEQGKTLGLVTLEDIVEELVGGDLEDEFDRLPQMCHGLNGGVWMIGGGFPVSDLSACLRAPLSNPQGNVSAWLVERIGHLPERNETFHFDGLEFIVRRIRRGKIFEISVRRVSE